MKDPLAFFFKHAETEALQDSVHGIYNYVYI